jgi:glutathione S-transferase
MVRPLKLYHHSQAPNPRRVRIFAAEKGIELALEEIDILAGQSRTPEFLAKNSSGAVPVLDKWVIEKYNLAFWQRSISILSRSSLMQ